MRKILAFFFINVLMMGAFAQIQVYPVETTPLLALLNAVQKFERENSSSFLKFIRF